MKFNVTNGLTELKNFLGIEEKAANDVMNTENPGFGEELVDKEKFASTVINKIKDKSRLLSMLPGNHGSKIPKSLVVPIIGKAGYMENVPEFTNSADRYRRDGKLPTGVIKLSRSKLRIDIPISDEMIADGVIDLDKTVRDAIVESGAKTLESRLINGDPTEGKNNINFVGGDTAENDTRHWYAANGLRKVAIENGILQGGALTASDLFDLLGKLGDEAANTADCLFLTNRRTATKVAQIPELVNAYQSGRASTLVKGSETNILGSDIYVSGEFKLAKDDGTISKEKAENTTGGILYLNKYAPQYGISEINIEPERVTNQGWILSATVYFAHAIANKEVGEEDPSVALLAGITL